MPYKDPEVNKAKRKDWGKKNKDKVRKYNQRYYQEHQEELRQRAREYGESHKDEIREKNRRWYQENREHCLERHRMAKYCVTQEQLDEMIDQQDNRCAICGQEFNEKNRLNVDHCHQSGDVRGLLCVRCNAGLGWYESWFCEWSDSVMKYIGDVEDDQ